MQFNAKWFATHFEEVMSVCLLAMMALLAFAGVITRYIFQAPIAFTEELEINALVWLTLFGTASAFRRRKHLRMMFVQQRMSPKYRLWLNILLNLLCIGLFTALGYLGYLQLLDEKILEITSESLSIPQWTYTLCIPLGCALIIFRIAESCYTEIKEQQ